MLTTSRRKFLGLLGGTAIGAVVFQACGVPEKELIIQAPFEMPEDLVTGIDNWYATSINTTPATDGVVVRVMEGRAKKIEGNIDHPINQGKHFPRTEATLQSLYNPDRISSPLVRIGPRGSGKWEQISWTDAIARVSEQISNIDDKSSILMANNRLSGHSQMILNNFTTSLGCKNLIYEPIESTNLRSAINHVFNQTQIPDFDIKNSKFLLSFGADFLENWVSPTKYSRDFGHFRQGGDVRGKMIHVSSRYSMTAANADEWIYVNPGTEGLLAMSIAYVIIRRRLGNQANIASLTNNGRFDMSEYSPGKVCNIISPYLTADQIVKIANEFIEHSPSLAIGGDSVGSHTNGFDSLSAIYSLNYLVNNIGKKGGVIYQPKPAMPELINNEIPGSFSEWEKVTTDMREGKINILLTSNIDPVYGLPGSLKVKEILSSENTVPLIVSFSGHMDDTTSMADLILPQGDPLEEWGTNIPDPGPGYQTLGFQQPVVRPFFESKGKHYGNKSFSDSLISISKTMDLDIKINSDSIKDLVKEDSKKLFNLNRGSVRAQNDKEFWVGVLQRGGWWDVKNMFKGKINKPPKFKNLPIPVFNDNAGYDFHLIPFVSNGISDGSGANLPWMQSLPDPISTATWSTWVEINLQDANKLDITEGDIIKITNQSGKSIEAIAYPNPASAPNTVCVPVGQGHTSMGRYAKNRGANVLSILDGSKDDNTGSLAWSATKVQIAKTGNWKKLPQMENELGDFPRDPERKVIKIDGDGEKNEHH